MHCPDKIRYHINHNIWYSAFYRALGATLVCCFYSLVPSIALAKGTTGQAGRSDELPKAEASIQMAQLDLPVKRLETSLPGKGTLAVFYPNNVSEPFRSIFTKIIEGIEERTKGRFKSYAIDKDKQDANELNGQLHRHDTRVVIALGRDGLRATAGIDHNIPIVVGGILPNNENDQQSLTGISLNPDPALLFARLKLLLPDIKKVLVVYNPQQNESLMKLARDAAKAQGLELVANEARDLATAARAYETLLANSDKLHSALWLPNDATTTEESTIMPLVLRESWNSSLPIFSSSLIHVKRGALFALYPNNLELGRNLASSALGVIAGETRKKGMQPLREVHLAVNLRTARHIGLHISPQQQSTFDFVFPEP